jgi:hypothetical protein
MIPNRTTLHPAPTAPAVRQGCVGVKKLMIPNRTTLHPAPTAPAVRQGCVGVKKLMIPNRTTPHHALPRLRRPRAVRLRRCEKLMIPNRTLRITPSRAYGARRAVRLRSCEKMRFFGFRRPGGRRIFRRKRQLAAELWKLNSAVDRFTLNSPFLGRFCGHFAAFG